MEKVYLGSKVKQIHGGLLNIKYHLCLKAADLWRVEKYIKEVPKFAGFVLCLRCLAVVAVRPRMVAYMNLRSKTPRVF